MNSYITLKDSMTSNTFMVTLHHDPGASINYGRCSGKRISSTMEDDIDAGSYGFELMEIFPN